MRLRALLFAAVAILTSIHAQAGEKTGTEMLFDTGALDGIAAGTILSYSHERAADEKISFRAISNGEILVSVVEEGGVSHSEVKIVNDSERRKLHHFPVDRGNPIFVTFLESSVSSVTFATKGSPFYIRNRLKDAFASGGQVTDIDTEIDGKTTSATQILYTPFKGDRNAAKMGQAFEALTVTFVLSEEVPGRIISMATEARVGDKQFFVEEVRFTDAKP